LALYLRLIHTPISGHALSCCITTSCRCRIAVECVCLEREGSWSPSR
jgi:hypothetical protein